ncbi:MAG: TonB-dependent receptor plug domain-containing protein, partial [Candidatus Marinimicrobia bacterium]|nr:TonB-dependent receptor plug domain-containing protein [Candidatus Neomarinimicrobiota bacterium]
MTKFSFINKKSQYTILFSVIFIISIGKIATFADPVRIGHVVDPNDNSVSFVTVHNISSDLWLITDEIGEFFIPHNFILGDSIEFIRIGYQRIVGVFPSNKKSFIITLPFAPVNLDSVEISKNSRHGYRSTTFVSKITILPQMGLVESRQAFSAIPGIYIKSYGGPAGISSLSLDGAPSSHTNISFAGFDLTSAQNGQLDVSQIPPNLVNNILYNP